MNTSKIIKGVVNGGRYTVTAPIVKEDYGIYLQIEGVELPSRSEYDGLVSINQRAEKSALSHEDMSQWIY